MWLTEVEGLHAKYRWLLFFRVPKLMILYELISAEVLSPSTIISEIGFLFQNDPLTRVKLSPLVEVSSP